MVNFGTFWDKKAFNLNKPFFMTCMRVISPNKSSKLINIVFCHGFCTIA